MKPIKKSLVMAGVALFSVALAGQDGVVLRRTLKENSTETYAVDSKAVQSLDIPGAGNQENNVSEKGTYVVKIGKLNPDKGTADFAITRTIDTIDADGAGADQVKEHKPKPFTMTGLVDNRGRLTIDYSKLPPSQVMNSSDTGSGGVMIDFPEGPVKVGDTWKVVVPKGPATYPEDQSLTAKLIGEKKVGDKDAWIISVTGKIKIDMDSSKLADEPDPASSPTQGMKFHLTGDMDITGESVVEKSTGITLRSESKAKGNQKLELAAVGATIDVTTTGTTIITLKE